MEIASNSSSFDAKELVISGPNENSADVPLAIFIEEVERFIGNRDPTLILAALKELLSKYTFMFESFVVQKRTTQRKIPDIQQAIETVDFIRKKRGQDEEIKTHFPLTDNCHAQAVIPPTDRVCLWLGANVMLEYSIEEAEELLRTSSSNATESIKKLDSNISYLRDQITTSEVNIARVHNHMVKIKAQLRARESEEAK